MDIYTALKITRNNLLLPAVAILFLVGCSSSQQVYDTDGIYSDGTTAATTSEAPRETTPESNANSQVYKNYFEKGAEELNALEEEDAIFTDIESYSSEEGAEIYVDGMDFETSTGYAAWGDQPQDIQVNVYNDPFIGGFGFGGFGFNRFGFGPFGFNRFGFGPYGFNRFGFNRFGFGGFGPFGFGGFGHFGYGGFGFVGNPYCFYGQGFYGNQLGYRNGFNNGFIGGRGRNNGRLASNSGRRGSANDVIAASRSRLREGRTASSRSRNTYARDKRSRANRTNSRNGVRSNRSYRDGQSRGTATRPNTRPNARPNSNSRPSRPNARPQGSSSRPSARPSRPSSRPSARPSRPSSRPSARPSRPSSRRSYSRPSSRSRSGGSFSRGGGSSRSSGGRSGGGRSGGRRG